MGFQTKWIMTPKELTLMLLWSFLGFFMFVRFLLNVLCLRLIIADNDVSKKNFDGTFRQIFWESVDMNRALDKVCKSPPVHFSFQVQGGP